MTIRELLSQPGVSMDTILCTPNQIRDHVADAVRFVEVCKECRNVVRCDGSGHSSKCASDETQQAIILQ